MLTLQECYEILGVTPNASPQAVRKAYLELAKRWHPDIHAHEQSSKTDVKNRFVQIQTAYEQIKAHQDASSDRPAESPTAQSAKQTESPVQPSQSTKQTSVNLTAEMLYENATELGKKGLYREAIAELSLAIRIDPHFILAYQYRGHLNSLLGLEYQAEADLSKAQTLKKLGNSATYRSPADIENLARKSPRRRRRSRFKRNLRRRHHNVSIQSFVFWSMVTACIAVTGLTLLNLANRSQQFLPQPLNIETPAIES